MLRKFIHTALVYGLSFVLGMLATVVVVALLTRMVHAQEEAFWAYYNAYPIPVYVDGIIEGEIMWLQWEAIDEQIRNERRCRDAVKRYQAAIVVLEKWTPEGENVMEFFADNMELHIKHVAEACSHAD